MRRWWGPSLPREQVAGRLLSGSASLEEAPRRPRVGCSEPGAHPSVTARVPPSAPHCTVGGGHRTPDHTDWRDVATQGYTRMSETLRSACTLRWTVDNGRDSGSQRLGRARQRVWSGLHPGWQGRPGRVGGGKEECSGSREGQRFPGATVSWTDPGCCEEQRSSGGPTVGAGPPATTPRPAALQQSCPRGPTRRPREPPER